MSITPVWYNYFLKDNNQIGKFPDSRDDCTNLEVIQQDWRRGRRVLEEAEQRHKHVHDCQRVGRRRLTVVTAVAPRRGDLLDVLDAEGDAGLSTGVYIHQ